MTVGFSGVESTFILLQSKAQRISDSDFHGLLVAPPLRGKGGMRCILKTRGHEYKIQEVFSAVTDVCSAF